jgi:hypothetical protein
MPRLPEQEGYYECGYSANSPRSDPWEPSFARDGCRLSHHSPDGFAGASTIRATPMTTSTADPTRNPTRWFGISNPNFDIATAWAKLDHAVKAIRLRFAEGFRTDTSKKCRA